MVSTPSAPDPYATADAQTKSNIATANATQETNMVNQVTPYGSLTYSSNGTNPDGTVNRTATTSLSPQLSGLVDTNLQNSQGNADLESALLGNASSALSKPVDLSYGANEARLDQLGRNTLDPQFQQQNDQLEQKLYDQGLRPGTEAYDNAKRAQSQSQGDQYNNLYLQGHQTATQDVLTAANQPLNALSALRSNSQVTQPGIQAAATPTASVAGTNISGLIEQNYQDQLNASSSALGGLFGLGGTLGGAALKAGMFSDERLKTDIDKVGKLDNGLPVYSYRYKGGGPKQIGVMAQDVEKVDPDAVGEVAGFKTVDYGRATRGGLFGLGG